jgi:hypothetical protein
MDLRDFMDFAGIRRPDEFRIVRVRDVYNRRAKAPWHHRSTPQHSINWYWQ